VPNFDKSASGTFYYKEEYNDLNAPMDPAIYQQLRDGDVDDLLAKHYAHLFIRDPLVVFRELLDVDDLKSSDHFENIQSTNWQTMRFKPPTPNSSIGWRVEFRSMDIQLTDHENTAFSTFIVLLAHTISHFDLNFYIPLSKVDKNMARCQRRNAVLGEKFYFRKDISRGTPIETNICCRISLF
jgi:glutamate--cysteine ligase catalytic subunit